MRVLQIVPRLSPPSDGVGDYAAALARALDAAGIPTTFLLPGPASERPESGGAAVLALGERTAEKAADAIASWAGERSDSAGVLVHYANYAYAPRGCPEWLVAGLERWRRSAAGTRLVAFFHEVYASGPPWRSSFWLSPAQRRLAAALARESDHVATSLELYRDLLARWVPAAAVAVLPVFSTVGELAAPLPLEARCRRLVVFGGPGGRARAYGEGATLAAACAALGVVEVADVGPEPVGSPAVAPATVAGVPVRRLGELSAGAVSALFADSLAGFVGHRPAFYGKSTVLAAYCAHGMLPVAARRTPAVPRPWAPGDGSGEAALQVAATAAAAWYAGHSLTHQVASFRRLLGTEGA